MRIALLAVALVTACGDDVSLEVIVEHDPSVAALIDHTSISIYAKPELTCRMIEFADVSPDELEGALAAEAELGQPLEGIPRVDDKLVVARGYAADGTLVAAGCNDKGVIDHDEKVVVTTVATATVTVGLGMSESMRGLIVATTDAANASIDGREVGWRLYGAAGTSADPARYTNVSDGIWEPKHATCTTDGDANIHPMPPLLPGGFALEIKVSWATQQPHLFSAFTSIDASNYDVSTVINGKVVTPCALQRRGGASSIACLSGPNQLTTYSYDVATRTAIPTMTALAPPSNDDWVGVVAVDAANGDRIAYAISNKGAWQDVTTTIASNSTWCGTGMLRCGADFTTRALVVVPACEAGQSAYLLQQSTDTPITGGPIHVRKMAIGGGPVQEFALKDVALIQAGCATELQLDGASTIARQVVVAEIPKMGDIDPFTAAVFDCAATRSPCTVPLPSMGQAIAFTKIGEPQLIGTTFDATGAQLTHWVFTPAEKNGVIGPKDRLVERKRQIAAAPPRRIVTGTFDDDDLEDLVWSFTARSEIDIQVAYGREALGEPLSALTAITTPTEIVPQPVAIFAEDFNDDGFDEIAFVFQTTVLTTVNTTLVIVPTGVPYANPPSPPDDNACK